MGSTLIWRKPIKDTKVKSYTIHSDRLLFSQRNEPNKKMWSLFFVCRSNTFWVRSRKKGPMFWFFSVTFSIFTRQCPLSWAGFVAPSRCGQPWRPSQSGALRLNHAFNGTGLTEGATLCLRSVRAGQIIFGIPLTVQSTSFPRQLVFAPVCKEENQCSTWHHLIIYFQRRITKKATTKKRKVGGINKLLSFSYSLLCSCEPRRIQRAIVSNSRQEVIYSKANHNVKTHPPHY